MANVKISELNELTQVDDDDLLVVVDTSANETKKIRAENVGTGGGGDSTPIGTIEAFSGSTAPNGYLMCDGSAVSRNAYADLFAVIGTTYGSGDGSTTFNLPNLKGRTVVMRDSSQTEFDTLGETGGSKELQEHNHGYTIANASGLYSETATSSSISGRGLIWGNDSANTGNAGTGNSGNLQPYIVLNYVIKAFKVSSTPATSQVVNAYSESTNNVYSCNYINGALIYSTEEVNTHKKWIDGKDIYRKCASFSSQSAMTQNSNLTMISISGVADVTLVSGYWKDNYFIAITNPLNTGGVNGLAYEANYYKDGSNFKLIFPDGSAGAISGKIIVEYTKTTDV